MNNTYENIESYQSFPMQMMCVCKSADENTASFEVKTCVDDFYRGPDGIPLFFLIELLGQAAETFLKIQESFQKRYLVEVDDFNITSDMQDFIDGPFEIKVERVFKLAKMNKCKVTMFHENKACCEGAYIHSGA